MMDYTAILSDARKWLENHKGEMIQDLKEFVSIRSVSRADLALEGAPFGAQCRTMLDYTLAKGEKYGFTAENADGHYGKIMLGDDESSIGMIAHLDVVPEGVNWIHPPYEGVVEGDFMFGRGVSDNKGSAIACLYVMRMVREMGLPVKHGLRLILGCSEETGMQDMEEYNRREKSCLVTLVPDAAFPVCYAQKGSLTAHAEIALGEDIAPFDGGLYAIPVKKDYAMMNFMTYPTEIAEELGFEIPDRIESFGELTPFLTAWKEAYPEEYPYLVGGGARGYDSSFDFIDRISGIGCVFGTTEVITVYDDPSVVERLAALGEWYDLGIINPDAAQISETAIDKSKKRISSVQAWPGYDYSVSFGYDTAMTCYFGPHLSADSVQGSMTALSVTLADQPEKIEAALKYIELCHTNQLFVDTLRYGVQGYHWNYVTEEQNPACAGAVQRTQVGNDNYNPWGFSQPAYFETSIAVSADQVAGTAKAPVLNQYDMYYHEVETNAKSSAMKGFTMDLTPYAQQLAEMQTIKDEYYSSFATGTIAFEEVREEFLGKMYAAGLQDLIDAAQEQLDAWLAQ